jgi:hypothetical protein
MRAPPSAQHFMRIVNEARRPSGLAQPVYDPAWDRGGANRAERRRGG